MMSDTEGQQINYRPSSGVLHDQIHLEDAMLVRLLLTVRTDHCKTNS